MKIRFKPLLLGMIVSAIGWLSGMIFSVAEPYYVAENAGLLWVLFLDFFWLLFCILIYQERKDKNGIIQVIAFYILIAIILSSNRFYRVPFDSVKWRTEVHTNEYGRLHFHQNGKMLPNLIESKLLIGHPSEKVLKTLGTQYDTTNGFGPHGKNFILMYWISGGYDNCDRLRIDIENDTCVKVDVVGCD